jgi:hypothetical protein
MNNKINKKNSNNNTSKKIAIVVSISTVIASMAAFACVMRKKTRTFEIKAVRRTTPVSST